MQLRTKVISGARWLSGSTAITAGLGFLQAIILSRLLSPRDFGLTAMAWVFLGFAQMFSDAGLSLATVQRHAVTPDQLSSVHWTNVTVASLIALLCCFASPLWVVYYHEPALAQLVPWATVPLVTAAFSAQFQAMAQRQLQFQWLAVGDALGVIAGFLVAITSAFLGAGAYAIILGGILTSTVKTIWVVARCWHVWHPSLHWRRRDLDGFLRFGGFQIGDRVANYIWNNADYMLIGRLLGSEALGYYRLAFETVVRPLSTVNPILNIVLYPVFAAKQSDNAALRVGFLEMVRLLASLVAPMMTGLCAVAPWAVAALFGPKWAPVAVLLQILSPMGILRALLNPTAQINIAKGRIDRVFYLNLTLAVILPIGFWFSAPYGLAVFCLTELLLLFVVMAASWIPLHRRTFGLAPKYYLLTVCKPVLLSLAMGGCVYGVSLLLPVSWSAAQGVSILVATGAAVQLALLLTFDKPYLGQMLRLIRNKT